MSVTLAQASTIVDVALKKARDSNLAPLTVAVLDSGGHLVAFKREDKSGILRFDIAYGKAWGALGMGFGSRELADRAGKNPLFFGVLASVSQGRLIPVPGGVLKRPGHTEATVDLCRLAGLREGGVLAEIVNDDGSMARLPQLIEFARRHGLPIVTIRDLIAYRTRASETVPAECEAALA